MSETIFVHRKSADYGKVPHELLLDTSISPGAVRLYAYMHWRHGSNQQHFEKRETMAQSLGVSATTISNWLAELENAYWIITIHRKNKSGHRISNRYHVFELQDECKEWRKRLKLGEPERKTPQEKSANKQASAKPTSKPRSTVVDMESDEPRSTVVDLGQGKPRSTVVESNNQTHSLTKIPDDHRSGNNKPPNGGSEGHDKSLFRYIQSTLVDKVWHGNVKKFGAAGDYANLLLGVSEKEQFKAHNLDQPVTRAEFNAFVKWWDRKKIDYPRRPDAWEQAVFDFRARSDYALMVAESKAVCEPQTASELSAADLAMAEVLGVTI